MIELTMCNSDNRKVYINKHSVSAVFGAESGACIYLTGDSQPFRVKETVQEVLEALSK